MTFKKFFKPSWCKLIVILILGLLLGRETFDASKLIFGFSLIDGYQTPPHKIVLGFPAMIVNNLAVPAMLKSCENNCKESSKASIARGLPAFACECGFGGVDLNNMPIQYRAASIVALLIYWYIISLLLCALASPINLQINKLKPTSNKIVRYLIISVALYIILYLSINLIYS